MMDFFQVVKSEKEAEWHFLLSMVSIQIDAQSSKPIVRNKNSYFTVRPNIVKPNSCALRNFFAIYQIFLSGR